MPSKYKFYNPEGVYFVTMSVVQWVDVFTRPVYKEIVVDSLNYSIQNKGLNIHGWVIMSNHLHLILSARGGSLLSDILRDFKKFTSKRIVAEIEDNIQESRKNWMLWIFKSAGVKNPNNKNFQFWQQDNHPVELDTNEMIDQRLNYLHENPVKMEFVENPEDFTYSSAKDYCGEKGLLKIEFLY